MVSADSLDRPVLCQPWIMDDGEPAGLTGNNSLPGGLTPFTGLDTTSRGGGASELTVSCFLLSTPTNLVFIGRPVATGNQP